MIDAKVTRLFFNHQAVLAKTDQATRRVLSRFGAFVRRTARQSIHKRRRSAAPGQPPSSHSGELKRFIYFSYEPGARNVVIGPARLTSKTGSAPEALEHGGFAMLTGKRKRRRAKIAARPFMGPAFTNEQPQLPRLWADSIR